MFEAVGITKAFSGNPVLKGVNLTIKPGEVVGLIGNNGTGKSVLIDILRGRMRPDEGKVLVNGTVYITRTFARRAPVFNTEQIPNLFNTLTGKENSLMGRWEHPGSAEYACADNALLHSDLPAGAMSLGQRRRIILEWLWRRMESMRFFMLDEPTAGADDEYCAMMDTFVEQCKHRKIGVLIVEHREAKLRALADRVVRMENGQIQSVGKLTDYSTDKSSDADSTPQRAALSQSPILSGSNLRIRRGKATILDGVNVSVRPGEIVMITGDNGIGKSTLLQALYGHRDCHIESGQIMFKGRDVTHASHLERSRGGIHLLPQVRTTFDSLTVHEFLNLTTDIYRRNSNPSANHEEVLDSFPHLRDFYESPCGALSGGQRRIAGLARVYLLKPDVMLLDEPMAGLDPEARKMVAAVLTRFTLDNAAIIAVEQSSFVHEFQSNQIINLSADKNGELGSETQRYV